MKAVYSLIVMLTLSCSVAVPAMADQYTFTDLGTLGENSVASGINDFGQVVGDSYIAGNVYHATLWQNGSISDLGTLGGSSSAAAGINNSGQVVGYSSLSGDAAQHATLWQSSSITDLGTLGGNNSAAYAINNAGQIVGGSSHGVLTVGVQPTLWQNGSIISLGSSQGPSYISTAYGINNVGQVVGGGNLFGGNPTLWQNGSATNLSTLGGPNGASAYAINNSGQIVGASWVTSTAIIHATLWQNGSITDLGTLGGGLSFASGINDAGSIVGSSMLAGNTAQHAVMWQNGGILDLNSFLSVSTKNAGWVLDTANAINTNGWIVGEATNSLTGVNSAYMLSVSAVPEPGEWLLMLGGLTLLGFVIRPRKSATSAAGMELFQSSKLDPFWPSDI